MKSSGAGAPAALPLQELLAALREEGLAIGVREHLTVGRLLARWPDCDTGELRSALAAVLARNDRESQVVRETFDRLYPGTTAEASSGEVGGEARAHPPVPLWRRARTRLAAVAIVLLPTAVALGLIVEGWRRPPPPPPPPVETPVSPSADQPPPPPSIAARTTTIQRLNWWKAGGLALLGAAVGLALVYRRRSIDADRRFMRRQWTDELDALPGPTDYELKLTPIEPAFRADLLDDVASVLGRHIDHDMKGGELDVERSLKRTLRAGMAPHVVWKVRGRSVPVVVLEDVGADMWPWRHRVQALLDGLACRGVALDRWRFDADAGRLFQGPGTSPVTLRQLARRRSEHPLLVISAGQGICEGEDRKIAAWVPLLRHWRSRAWLHPVSDLRYWRSELAEIGVLAWPMTPQGILAAAQQLARGEARLREVRDVGVAADRPVAPLDVERLRWLISLAPRRDPALAELLRQRFSPHVPQAALLEALAASSSPPRPVDQADRAHRSNGRHPGVGPSAEEVHAFLAQVLAASEPAAGTGAHERWRLDRALQEIRSGQGADTIARAGAELAALASGPAAPMVEDATARAGLDPTLERGILGSLHRRAGREALVETARGAKAWTRPRMRELVAAIVCGGVALAAGTRVDVLTRDAVTSGQEVYRLELARQAAQFALPTLRLSRRPEVTDPALAPDQVDIMASLPDDTAGERVSTAKLAGGSAELTLSDPSSLNRYYWGRANRPDGLVALSNQVWVGLDAMQPTSTPTLRAPSPTPTSQLTTQVGPTIPVRNASPTRTPRPPTEKLAITSVRPGVIERPGSIMVVLRGAKIDPRARIDVKWSGVTARDQKSVSESELAVQLEVAADAPSGTAYLVVRNPDGETAQMPLSIALSPRPLETRPDQNQLEQNQIVPNQRNQNEPSQNAPNANRPDENPAQQSAPNQARLDCPDLSGLWTAFDDDKTRLRLTIYQNGCALTGGYETSRWKIAVAARFEAKSKAFSGNLELTDISRTANTRGDCSGSVDARILVRDPETITITSGVLSCQQPNQREQSRTWNRQAAAAR